MLKKILLSVLVVGVALVLVVVTRAAFFNPAEQGVKLSLPILAEVNKQQVAERLSQAIKIKTISYDNPKQINKQPFDQFVNWLAVTYPQVHQKMTRTLINEHTLLFHWQGSGEQKPILLSAHYDVVPVIPGTESKWQHPPFDGVVDNEFIWGRGALDDKSAAIAMMEASELLLTQGVTPTRDIYITLTHDEEIGSRLGAKAVTEWFESQQIELAWSLDEGSFVLKDIVPGVSEPVAMINVAEKGFLTVELVANAKGGHSSMPPKDTAVTILADGLIKLRNNQVAGGLTDISADMYNELGKHMSFSYKILFANTWLFKPIIENVMGGLASGNAMLRTTTAATMLSGSIKANVLPITATAMVNFRLHPRDNKESVLAHIKSVIDDERIEVKVVTSFPASRVSAIKGEGFKHIARHAKHVHRDSAVTPGMTVGATDSRYYTKITDAYRFNPMVITNDDLAGFHGTNEKISIDNMVKAVQFYAGLMAD